ncbi:MAG: sulfite exporter TauE/SafE family protein [Flavobacteriaceae bacterium]
MLEYLLLIGVGFIAGFVNTIAGGGTLLTMPILIFMGLPPSVANGTNRVAILIQTAIGVKGFQSKEVSTYPFSVYLGISALFGSLIGAQIAVDIKGDTFNKILSVIMVLVVIMILLKPKMKMIEMIERTTGKHLIISIVIFFFLGIYGGFVNAGIGFMMLIVLPYVNRLSLVKSNATKVAVVCIYTIGAVFMFALNDKVNWKLGLILAIGNASGAWISSRWSVGKGDGLVKTFVVIMICVLSVKLWFF